MFTRTGFMYHMVHFPPVDGKSSRERLLDEAIDYVAHHGLTDVSLRTLATALGTSHRMLIHHFGSKEGLWVEIVRSVEARQRALLGQILPDADQPLAEAMRAWWKHISDPKLWPNERLFFEIYGQALQGRTHSVELLDGIVDDWLEPATTINVSLGVAPDLARAHARLGIAVTRGLLLDLLATRDTAAVDGAMEAFIDVYTSWLEDHAAQRHPESRPPSRRPRSVRRSSSGKRRASP
jgi:AcrR family transcriptional regulator